MITQAVTFAPTETSPQNRTIERRSSTFFIPPPPIIYQSVLRRFPNRFILRIINGIIPLQPRCSCSSYLRIRLRIVYISHLVQDQILRYPRIVDAMYSDQRTVIIQHVISDIRINLVFPFQFIPVSDTIHFRVYLPWIVRRFKQDMRHQLAIPIISGHHGEIKTYSFTHIRYVRDACIAFGIRSPCM